jgi:ATP adenylyltransferase
MEGVPLQAPREAAASCLALYRELLERLHCDPARDPHNLLVTRERLLLVLRRCEEWEGVSVNALGFAGALLVRDGAALERVRRVGPLAVLRAVARRD